MPDYGLLFQRYYGPEFVSKALDNYSYQNNIKLEFSRPGKPVDNAFIESFNGSLRDECLNTNWFLSIEDARLKLEAWRVDYNEYRPHSSLGNLSTSLSEALKDTEEKGEALKREIDSLLFQKQNKFTSPPKEWISHRLEELRDTLNQNTVNSSIALKKLLGNISLEPITDKKSDFYYIVSNGDIKFKPI